MGTLEEDLEALRRRGERALRAVQLVNTIPELALEAVEDLEATALTVAGRHLTDLTPRQRRKMADLLDQHEAIVAQIRSAIVEAQHRRSGTDDV